MTEIRASEAKWIDRDKPIVEMRAVNYSWAEVDPQDAHGRISTTEMKKFRVEIRRAGETEWTEIPVIERAGKPPG